MSRFAALGILLPLMANAPAAHAQQSPARPFLHPLFTNNTVLQRDVRAPIWGWASPGDKVTVEVAGLKASATADATGKWMVHIGPLQAGGPYTMTVSGPQTVTLTNVLVGDVWVCSGQSNMQMGIANVNNGEQEIAAAEYPRIRLFTVPDVIGLQPRETVAGKWDVCTPQTVAEGGWGGFSAVGYFFGRDLYRELHVPIGLIHTSWGGTPAEAWTSAEALSKLPEFRPAIAYLSQIGGDPAKSAAAYESLMAEWWRKNDPGSAEGLGWADPALSVADWKTMTLPTKWESAGLPNYDGVVWFRTTFDLPNLPESGDVTLSLGPIDDMDTTWVNGVKVGETNQYNVARTYKVPANILKRTGNVVAVRVLDTGGDGGLCGAPDQLYVETSGGRTSLAGEWRYKPAADLTKTGPPPQRVDNNPNYPTVLYNAMIAPLIPFAIKGVIWYQGESNAGRAYQYRKLLPTMIADWRGRWGLGDFPFLIVQLANFMAPPKEPVEDAWAELREAQSMTAASVRNAGIAVAIDIGDAADIHPKNKQEVGRRLALVALAKTYGRHLEYAGPTYKSMSRHGNAIKLTFTHTEGGLVGKGGKLQGFAIGGSDRKFVWADAEIQGNAVIVSSPLVEHPVAVRYAWAANPVCNLYNGAGLPASPFRTDDWPGITANAK